MWPVDVLVVKLSDVGRQNGPVRPLIPVLLFVCVWLAHFLLSAALCCSRIHMFPSLRAAHKYALITVRLLPVAWGKKKKKDCTVEFSTVFITYLFRPFYGNG